MSMEDTAHRNRMAQLARKDMAQKGPGDFSPPDPKECPEDCQFIGEDGKCTEIECVREEIAYWDAMYTKSDRV